MLAAWNEMHRREVIMLKTHIKLSYSTLHCAWALPEFNPGVALFLE
jgi:hypothetical protein